MPEGTSDSNVKQAVTFFRIFDMEKLVNFHVDDGTSWAPMSE